MGFRRFDSDVREAVREFYRENHTRQTLEFARARREAYGRLDRARLGVFDALSRLDSLFDESDPDLELGQLQHALQTAEALRADGREEWLILVGLIHDLGKLLVSFGEPQWAVVGDTFPLGCAFRPSVVYPELFEGNPDRREGRFGSELGVYERGVGLRNVVFSWGHDEYLYQVLQPHLDEPALSVIRFHSFYAWHREGDYADLCDAHDREILPLIQTFSRYDLYSKTDEPLDWSAAEPYYRDLVARHLPATLAF